MFHHQPDRTQLLRPHRQWFSRLGWALFAQMAAMLVLQLLASGLFPRLLAHPVSRWCLSVGSAYGVGVPAFCLVLRGMPAPPDGGGRRPLGLPGLGRALVVLLGLVYLSNLFTLLLTRLLGTLWGGAVTNPVDSLTGYPTLLNLLLGCVIAPFSEEYLFRRLLLSRLRPYGDCFAISASALCFSLFHGNLNQYFYAFAVGVILAYVVLRTGCLWQAILLHALVNFTSVGLVPLLEQLGRTGAYLTSLLILGTMAAGVALLAAGRRSLVLEPGRVPFRQGLKWRLFLGSPGVLFFCLLSLLLAISYVL